MTRSFKLFSQNELIVMFVTTEPHQCFFFNHAAISVRLHTQLHLQFTTVFWLFPPLISDIFCMTILAQLQNIL